MPNRQPSNSQKETDIVSLPDAFFTGTLGGIQDLAELKTVLYVAYLSLRKQDPRHPDIVGVTYDELKAETLRLSVELGEETLRRALDSAVEHGTLVHSTLNINGVLEGVYSLTDPAYRGHQPQAVNIFALYEQNIGMITPMIAEELKEAEKLYPSRWIEEAFKEAAVLNKRSWKYIARILERWASEGKDSGEYKGHAKKIDPDKYIRGKYGHMVRR